MTSLWERRDRVLTELGAMKSWDFGSPREQELVAEMRRIDARLFPTQEVPSAPPLSLPDVAREMPAWTWSGFLLRRLLSLALDGGPTCDARRCGCAARHGSRFCTIHQDALLAIFGSGQRAIDAARRLEGFGRLTRRRLERWAHATAERAGDVFDLVAVEEEPFEARGGIVCEGV